jgi:hypothetical protein
MNAKKIKQVFFIIILSITCANAQSEFPNNLASINGFRNPSIGVEYQHKQVSVHSGYYVTNFESGVTTEFFKAGLTYWAFPMALSKSAVVPSSFYISGSYALGTSRDFKEKNAIIGEAGFRWFVWKGLNVRLGVAALSAEDHQVKINPTPGISYSFKF